MQNFEKLAALGAKGVAGGAMAAWLGFAALTRPVSSGGVDPVTHLAMMAATFVVFGMVALSHFYFGMQLAKGRDSVRG
ncbi:MAG TPA: hypothetical protein PK788_01565 [Gemmatimonadaceae bacterium]|nr:hypothetical protein [Gemmatimonadaceae bacterium]HRQ77391.1 hypothetical protein [Gemmatimonadaceae bacterium]